MNEIRLGNASASPGKKAMGRMTIGEFASGLPIEVPVIIVNGAHDGPRLWLISSLHGGETTGTFAILNVVKELNAQELGGAITAIPMANVVAMYGIRGRSLSGLDYGNMNRSFPGNPDGSFIEQVSNVLFREICDHADYLIDFHSGGDFHMSENWIILGKTKRVKAKELAKAFGFEYIVETTDQLYVASSLSSVATEAGIPGIVVESGGGGTIQELRVGACQQGITNVLKNLKMIEGQPELPRSYTFLSGWKYVHARHGGLCRVSAKLGAKVSKGEILGTVTNCYGEEIERVTSPDDGIVLATRTYPLISSGEPMGELGFY